MFNKVLTVVSGTVIGVIALAGPAQAQLAGPEQLDSPEQLTSAIYDEFVNCSNAEWQARDIGPDLIWVDAQESSLVDSNTVNLTKFSGDIGTSLETTDLGLAVSAGDVISINYSMSGGAAPDAGAVRMFYYFSPDADTITVAPADTVIADLTSGQLILNIVSEGTIGTFGLTYDASNGSVGTVTFTDLAINNNPIAFNCIEPQEPTVTQPTECGDLGTLSYQLQEGVIYEVYDLGNTDAEPGDWGRIAPEVVEVDILPEWIDPETNKLWVHAIPDAGYRFLGEQEVHWWFTIELVENCPSNPPLDPVAEELPQTGSPVTYLVFGGILAAGVGLGLVLFARDRSKKRSAVQN